MDVLPARMRRRVELVLEKRRWPVRGAVAALALTFFVLVPGYIATQPKFLERYSSMGTFYTSWATSTHAEVSCQSCHIAPRVGPRALHAVRMLGEFYASIVMPSRQPKLFSSPRNEPCTSCHQDTRTTSPAGDLKIPHRAHVRVLKLSCVHCHSYVVHTKNPEGKHTPRMATCLVCHDGRKARKDCPACHEKKDLPANHKSADWAVLHALKQKEIDCKSCHGWTDRWCRQCHLERPKSHAARWRTNHRFKVQRHRDCEACHKGSFCVRCHGEVPRLNLDPTLRLVE
jgi:hypothetical protein